MAKNTRPLLQSLILSVTLNVVFVGIFFYFLIRDNPLHFSYTPKQEKNCERLPCPPTFLQRLSYLSFEQTLELLKDEREVKDGFLVRDFALGALSSFHNFDVKRALNRSFLQKRVWSHEESSFVLFPYLKDVDFQKIENFSKVEKWPLTTKGLFLEIEKKTLQESDPELLVQFCHTPEFILAQTLLARKKIPIQKRSVLALLLEGGWENLEKFHMEQEKECGLSDKTCREFLLNCFSVGSKTAAYLLILTDEQYVLAQFDDLMMEKFVDLLTVKTKEACQFLHKLSSQERSNMVLEKAKLRLHHFGEKELAARFFNRPAEGELRPKFRDQAPISVDPSVHIIQDGESLWLISRKYNVPIEHLMQVNGLQSTIVRPGKMLKIPHP